MEDLKKFRHLCIDMILNPSYDSDFHSYVLNTEFIGILPNKILLKLETTYLGKNILEQLSKPNVNSKPNKFRNICNFNKGSERIIYKSVVDRINSLNIITKNELWEIYKLRVDIGDYEVIKMGFNNIPDTEEQIITYIGENQVSISYSYPIDKYDILIKLKSWLKMKCPDYARIGELIRILDTIYYPCENDTDILSELCALSIDKMDIWKSLRRIIDSTYSDQERMKLDYIAKYENPNSDQLDLLYLVLTESDGIPSSDDIRVILSQLKLPLTDFEQTKYNSCIDIAHKNIASILKNL